MLLRKKLKIKLRTPKLFKRKKLSQFFMNCKESNKSNIDSFKQVNWANVAMQSIIKLEERLTLFKGKTIRTKSREIN